MKRIGSQRTVRRRLIVLLFVVIAGMVTFVVSASRNASRSSGPAARVLVSPRLESERATVRNHRNGAQPLQPFAASIVATLSDNVTAATKIAPGGTINYTATITNNGAATPADDATNLNFSAPLDANTTLVGGSIHASPIARNDTYNWVGNTVLDTSARALPTVIANDVAVNAPGGTDTFNATPIAGGATTLGGSVTLLATGHYTYTPPLNKPALEKM